MTSLLQSLCRLRKDKDDSINSISLRYVHKVIIVDCLSFIWICFMELFNMSIVEKQEFMKTREFKKLPDAVRFSVEREVRGHWFDKVCPSGDWKEPFYCEHNKEDWYQIDQACKFFTGSGIDAVGHRPNGQVVSYCKGYYMMGT